VSEPSFDGYNTILAKKGTFVLKIKYYTNGGEKGLLIKSIRRIWGKSFRKANVDNFQLPSSSETPHHRGGPPIISKLDSKSLSVGCV